MEDMFIGIPSNNPVRSRKIWLSDEINETSVVRTICYLDKIKKNDKITKTKKPITIVCNSHGGMCSQGFILCSYLENMVEDGYEIITLTGGISASMSFLIGLCGSTRKCYRYSNFLCHQPSNIGGDGGSAISVSRQAEYLNKLWETMKGICKKHTDMSEEILNKIYNESIDYIFDAEEALKLKIVDEII